MILLAHKRETDIRDILSVEIYLTFIASPATPGLQRQRLIA
jgi:hypothetical protein